MNALYILQIMSAAVDLPELDVHNLLNSGGIAFLIWHWQRHVKKQDSIDKSIHDILVELAAMKREKETEIRLRNENKE